MSSIAVNDIVTVSLANGAVLIDVEVTDLPKVSFPYWEFVTTAGVVYAVPDSLICIRKNP